MKQTVFVVEDDADISRLLKHYLEQAGFLVRTFPRADKVTLSAPALSESHSEPARSRKPR
jgi:DNA-binding response OmpR family regulator